MSLPLILNIPSNGKYRSTASGKQAKTSRPEHFFPEHPADREVLFNQP